MNWIPFIIGTVGAILATGIFYVLILFLSRFSKKQPEPTIEELKRDRHALSITVYFAVMWIMSLSKRVDTSMLGYWSGPLFAVGLILVFAAARRIYTLRNRSHSASVNNP